MLEILQPMPYGGAFAKAGQIRELNFFRSPIGAESNVSRSR